MKRASLLLISAVLLLAAACSSDSKTSSSTSSSSSSTSSSSSPSSSASSGAPSGAGTAAALAAATNAKVGKSILTDSKGKTVYLYTPDGTNTTSQVSAGLKQAWPPVTVTGDATAGTGLDQSKLSVQAQPDGTKQLAYNGHLLYTYVGDSAAGDANGQGLGGVWYVLGTDGNKIDSD